MKWSSFRRNPVERHIIQLLSSFFQMRPRRCHHPFISIETASSADPHTSCFTHCICGQRTCVSCVYFQNTVCGPLCNSLLLSRCIFKCSEFWNQLYSPDTFCTFLCLSDHMFKCTLHIRYDSFLMVCVCVCVCVCVLCVCLCLCVCL